MRLMNIVAISLLLFSSWENAVAENFENNRFHEINNSVVTDSKTGLMWALKDNGKDINWWEAQQLTKDFSAAGYNDWRLPDIKELATLYTSDERNKDGYLIAKPFKITDCCTWSSYDIMGGALTYSFKSGKEIPVSFSETYQLRVLPVRGTSKIDLDKY